MQLFIWGDSDSISERHIFLYHTWGGLSVLQCLVVLNGQSSKTAGFYNIELKHHHSVFKFTVKCSLIVPEHRNKNVISC